MPFDGFFISALINEMQSYVGRRIDRIHQPKDDTISLSLGRGTHLILCINPSAPRFYITTSPFANPMTPPAFCMFLRKHLQGGFLEAIEQLENDRIVAFHFTSTNELGYKMKKTLMLEIMGKHSNLILMDTATNEIHDAMKRVYNDMSRVRQLFPGEIYDPSPIMGEKLNPFQQGNLPSDRLPRSTRSLWRNLIDTYMGFSPTAARHIALHASIDPVCESSSLTTEEWKQVDESFAFFLRNTAVTPQIYRLSGEKKPEDFYCRPLIPFDQFIPENVNDLSQVVETFYSTKLDEMRKSQREQALTKQIKSLIDRQRSKIDALSRELTDAQSRETLRLYGDLLSASLHLVKERRENVTLPNYYDPNMTNITIPLDPALSPVANAQRYYKKYRKLKNAESHIIQQLDETKKKLAYLENTLFDMTLAQQDDVLEDIKEDLYEAGFIRKYTKKKGHGKKSSTPLTFTTPNGLTVWVGRNSRENDRLTFKLSHKEDLWFHVKDYAGSHVILRAEGDIPTAEDLVYTAQLAAQYSAVKWDAQISVDYTKRRYVKRIPQGGLGLVHYDHQQTILVKPSFDPR